MVLANPIIETATEAEVARLSERAWCKAVNWAAVNSPFYRWFYRRLGVKIETVIDAESLRANVPLVSKQDILQFQEEFGGSRRRSWAMDTRQVHLTSGTSGAGREVHFRTQADLAAMGIGAAYALVWAGLAPAETFMLNFPYSQTMGGPSFQAFCDAAGVIPVNGFAVAGAERLQQLKRFQCAGMSASPSYLQRLTVLARENGFVPSQDAPCLRTIVLSAEPYGLAWAQDMEDFWGAKLAEAWGATQTLGWAMATCERGAIVRSSSGSATHGVFHSFDHRYKIEVLDEDGQEVPPGDTGEIVVTTFRSQGLPAIRFRMGDRIRRLPANDCGCGRPFACYQAGTVSRLDDMIKIKGQNVWPSAVDAIVLRGPVVGYMARIYTDGHGRESVEIALELDETLIPDPHAFCLSLKDQVTAVIGISVEVRHGGLGSLPEQYGKTRRWSDERSVQT
jgi:phenylacetate-CoA ligase